MLFLPVGKLTDGSLADKASATRLNKSAFVSKLLTGSPRSRYAALDHGTKVLARGREADSRD